MSSATKIYSRENLEKKTIDNLRNIAIYKKKLILDPDFELTKKTLIEMILLAHKLQNNNLKTLREQAKRLNIDQSGKKDEIINNIVFDKLINVKEVEEVKEEEVKVRLSKRFGKFLYTLDPISLGNQPEHIKKKLYDFSIDNINTSWGRILYNHFSIPQKKIIMDFTKLSKENPLYISGPISLTKHESKEYEKTIYIFGDRHGIENACDEKDKPLTILDFLKIYTENIDKFIDIYLESDYIITESGEKYCLSKLNYYRDKEYFDCFLLDVIYLLPKQPNIRIHRTDLRSYLNITQSNVLNKIVYGLGGNLTRKELEQFLKDYNKEDYYEILMSRPVKKQLEKIANETLREKILNFLSIQLQRLRCKNYLKLIRAGIETSILNNIPIENVFKSYPFKNIYLYEDNSGCIELIMDIYLIARLFKIHEVESGEYHPTEAKNVFIYAGNDHAETYRRFLMSIGFSHENIATQTNKRCIRVFKPIVF